MALILSGNSTYAEQSEVDTKITGDSKQIATAWVNFNGTSIVDGFNIASVAFVSSGIYRLTVTEALDFSKVSIDGWGTIASNAYPSQGVLIEAFTATTVDIGFYRNNALNNVDDMQISIFGGKA